MSPNGMSTRVLRSHTIAIQCIDILLTSQPITETELNELIKCVLVEHQQQVSDYRIGHVHKAMYKLGLHKLPNDVYVVMDMDC